MNETTENKKKVSKAAVVAGGIASLALAASFAPSALSAFTASITNTTNTAAVGNLEMTEWADANADSVGDAGTAVVSSSGAGNAATATSINKYSGDMNMAPGESNTTQIIIENSGSVDADMFTLTPGAVTVEDANGNPVNPATADALSEHVTLVVEQDGAEVYNGKLADFTALENLSVVNAGAGDQSVFTFDVSVDTTAPNTVMGQDVSQPMTWTYTN